MKAKPFFRLTHIFFAIATLTLLMVIFKSSSQHNGDFFYDRENIPETAPYLAFSPSIPENLSFCGEKVPIERFDVKESLDLELIRNMYFHSNTILVIKRFSRYKNIMQPILEEHKVPLDILYLAMAESNLQNVVSPSGARGIWQFMKPTAEQYGLLITNSIDERYELEKATHAACKYLNYLNRRFGNWALAAAAYNMGQGALDIQLKRQEVDSYYDLHLNEETARYVFRILAFKLINEKPEKYGFYLKESEKYPALPTQKLTIDSSRIDLVAVSKQIGTTYKMIRMLNPHLRNDIIEVPKGKSIDVFVPEFGNKEVWGSF